jgi:para-aminobenzoate synthetase
VATLLIDNYDSFTHNLAQLVAEIYGDEPLVVPNDEPGFEGRDLSDFEAVFISPGPGRPDRRRDFGVSRLVLDAGIPVLGVCLGHQGICHLAGGRVERAPEPVHGRTSEIFHRGEGLFAGLPSPFMAVRYHSLAVTEVPADLEVTARTSDGTVMGVAHRSAPVFGVQFHPESVATEFGVHMIANFRQATRRRRVVPRAPGRRAHVRPPRKTTSPTCRSRWRRLDLDLDPTRVFEHLFADSPTAFWLDGTAPYGDEHRYSYMGDDSGPLAELITYDVSRDEAGIQRGELHHEQGPFLSLLDRRLKERSLPAEAPVPFGLGFVGYLGYELKAECGGDKTHRSPTPDAALLFADRVIAFDHRAGAIFLGQLELAGDAPDDSWLVRTADTLRVLSGSAPASPPRSRAGEGDDISSLQPISSPDDGRHLDNVREALEEILQGESYEICLTRQTSLQADLDPEATWGALRRSNQAAYAALFRFPGLTVLSASPERFLKISAAGAVESRPIKGTAPRGADPTEDRVLGEALRGSAKDRAENLMVVDMVRSDLARVSEIGSVAVTSFAELECLPSAHQLVSRITSRLASGCSPIDCVRSAFPGGSMTGAPKVRSMEIIDRLEGAARGVYSGALGWFGLDGALDLGMVIRTLVITDREASIGSGGAIVAGSDPGRELAEADLKRRAVIEHVRAVAPDIATALR